MTRSANPACILLAAVLELIAITAHAANTETVAGSPGRGDPTNLGQEVHGVAAIGSRLYLSDPLHGVIRTLEVGQPEDIFYCNGTFGRTCVRGTDAESFLVAPGPIATAPDDTFYVADWRVVWHIDPERRTIDRVAGSFAGSGCGGDGGPAKEARLQQIIDVARDPAGNLFIVDALCPGLRRVDAATGKITTLAANTFAAVAVDASGRVFALEYNRLVQVSDSGQVSELPPSAELRRIGDLSDSDLVYDGVRRELVVTAGNGGVYRLDPARPGVRRIADLPYRSAGLMSEATVDAGGTIYVTADDLFSVTPAGDARRIAGNRTQRFGGDGGPAVDAQLDMPNAVAVEGQSRFYIADTRNHRVRLVDDGEIRSVLGRDVPFRSGSADWSLPADILGVHDVALDADGNLYLSEWGAVWKVNAARTSVQRIATNREAITLLGQFDGLAVAADGTVYVADAGCDRVLRLAPRADRYEISVFAGTGEAPASGPWPCSEIGYAGDGGSARSASLNDPLDVAVDDVGNVFIADSSNGVVRIVTPDGVIDTYFDYDDPGRRDTARSLAIAADGSLLVSGRGVYRVRNGIGEPIAGGPGYGFDGDGGDPLLAQFARPVGLAVEPSGTILVADQGNHRIRRIDVPRCGDGARDSGEECDSFESCCTPECELLSWGTGCAKTGTSGTLRGYCNGRSSTCGGVFGLVLDWRRDPKRGLPR